MDSILKKKKLNAVLTTALYTQLPSTPIFSLGLGNGNYP